MFKYMYLAVLQKLLLVPLSPRAGVADDVVLFVHVHLLDALLQLLLWVGDRGL